MNFRIYACGLKGYEFIGVVYNEEDIELYINGLDLEIYDRILVIKHNIKLNMDEGYLFQSLENSFKRKRKKK